MRVVDRLKELAQERAITVTELAAGWTLSHPAVDVAIVGARRPSHLEGTAAAAALNFSLEDLDTIFAYAVPVWGPHPEGM